MSPKLYGKGPIPLTF